MKLLMIIVICLSHTLNQVKGLSVEELEQLVLDQFTESYDRIIKIEKNHKENIYRLSLTPSTESLSP